MFCVQFKTLKLFVKRIDSNRYLFSFVTLNNIYIPCSHKRSLSIEKFMEMLSYDKFYFLCED